MRLFFMMEDIKSYQFFQDLVNLEFVEKILLFGSRARENHVKTSDIDLAIVCPGASENEWFEVLDIIDQADTLLKIDCVRLDQLGNDEPIRAKILSEGKVLFERECK